MAVHKERGRLKALIRAGLVVCVKCESTTDLTIDHIKPRSKGGGDSEDNLQVMCRDCNKRKANLYTPNP